jgi:hypothetical protein
LSRRPIFPQATGAREGKSPLSATEASNDGGEQRATRNQRANRVKNQTPPVTGTGETPPASATPQEESEDIEIRRFAIGVILFTATCVTLLSELALALVGAGLKVTAMAAVSVFGGTFSLGYFIAKRCGYIRTSGPGAGDGET